jgi:hypothetical protein
MKGKEFADLLNELSAFLRCVDAREVAVELSMLARVFSLAPRREVGDLCSVLSGVEPPEHNNGLRTQEMLSLFPALRRLLKRAKADKGTLQDLDTFENALRAQKRASPKEVADAAIKKLREQAEGAKEEPTRPPLPAQSDDLVDQYAMRLEASMRDGDKFNTVFEELKADTAIKRPEAIALAKRFAKETAKSRDHALKLIMTRHTALLGSRARQKATKGRTAA